ncbi:MAG: hypothetical protein ACI865_002010, partial [Flavobacteriaceae bacterium]
AFYLGHRGILLNNVPYDPQVTYRSLEYRHSAICHENHPIFLLEHDRSKDQLRFLLFLAMACKAHGSFPVLQDDDLRNDQFLDVIEFLSEVALDTCLDHALSQNHRIDLHALIADHCLRRKGVQENSLAQDREIIMVDRSIF